MSLLLLRGRYLIYLLLRLTSSWLGGLTISFLSLLTGLGISFGVSFWLSLLIGLGISLGTSFGASLRLSLLLLLLSIELLESTLLRI